MVFYQQIHGVRRYGTANCFYKTRVFAIRYNIRKLRRGRSLEETKILQLTLQREQKRGDLLSINFDEDTKRRIGKGLFSRDNFIRFLVKFFFFQIEKEHRMQDCVLSRRIYLCARTAYKIYCSASTRFLPFDIDLFDFTIHLTIGDH